MGLRKNPGQKRWRSTRRAPEKCRPRCEGLESRAAAAVVLIFNGNAFGETEPNEVTRDLARRLKEAGHRGIEVSLPAVSAGLLRRLERKVERLDAKYGHVGVAGFSAGGTLAARLALSSDRIDAALACYGPLDLSDWFAYHRVQGTPFSRESMRVVRGHLRGRHAIAALSGPGAFDTPIVAAFGARDRNVTYETNEASARKLGARVRLVQYAGPHGTIAPREAFDLFVEELDRAERAQSVLGAPRDLSWTRT